jgi:hypothetical protein
VEVYAALAQVDHLLLDNDRKCAPYDRLYKPKDYRPDH